ncbi:hypothetical protein ABZP36_024387 [Zizania latifolia]
MVRGGGGGGASLGLDLSVVIQAAVVGLVLFLVAFIVVHRAASRYFIVDAAGFAAMVPGSRMILGQARVVLAWCKLCLTLHNNEADDINLDSVLPIKEQIDEAAQEKPTHINAFQLIGMASAFDLSGFFEEEVRGGGGGKGTNLDQFFDDVEGVKDDMRGLEGLHRRLQSAHEESKTAHDACAVKSLRCRMDADVEQVLRRAKAVKAKLEALHRTNAASRKLPSCSPGFSTDRTRSSVVSGLGNKLKDLMDGLT